MTLKFNGKEVDVEIDYSGAACDAFITSGYYTDTLEELTEDELDQLTEQATERIAEYCLEHTCYWRE